MSLFEDKLSLNGLGGVTRRMTDKEKIKGLEAELVQVNEQIERMRWILLDVYVFMPRENECKLAKRIKDELKSTKEVKNERKF